MLYCTKPICRSLLNRYICVCTKLIYCWVINWLVHAFKSISHDCSKGNPILIYYISQVHSWLNHRLSKHTVTLSFWTLNITWSKIYGTLDRKSMFASVFQSHFNQNTIRLIYGSKLGKWVNEVLHYTWNIFNYYCFNWIERNRMSSVYVIF